jgi:hypothetical protein
VLFENFANFANVENVGGKEAINHRYGKTDCRLKFEMVKRFLSTQNQPMAVN